MARVRGYLVRRRVRDALTEPGVALAAGVVVGVVVGVALVALLVAAASAARKEDQ